MKPFIHPSALWLATVFNATIAFIYLVAEIPPPFPHLLMLTLSVVIAVMCLLWQPYFLRNMSSNDRDSTTTIAMVLIVSMTFVASMLAFRYAVNIFIQTVWMKFAVVTAMALIATGISYYFFARSPRTDIIKDGH